MSFIFNVITKLHPPVSNSTHRRLITNVTNIPNQTSLRDLLIKQNELLELSLKVQTESTILLTKQNELLYDLNSFAGGMSRQLTFLSGLSGCTCGLLLTIAIHSGPR